MTCSVCGAEAAIRRDAAYYCGRCAVARDWGDVIAMVQDGRANVDVVFDETSGQDQASADDPAPIAATSSGGDPFGG